MSWLSKLLQKIFKTREQADGDVVKPFLEHLEDLRWTLFKMAAVLAVGMIIGFVFVDDISAIILKPLRAIIGDVQLQSLQVTEAFMVSLTLAFYSGIVLAFPLLFFFAAEFVLPAL